MPRCLAELKRLDLDDARRRPHRRSQWRATRRGRRERIARSLPAGRDAAYLRAASRSRKRRWRCSKLSDDGRASRLISPSWPSKPGTWNRSSANCWRKCNRRSSNRCPAEEETVQPELVEEEGLSPDDEAAHRTALRASQARPRQRLRTEARARPAGCLPRIRGSFPRPVQDNVYETKFSSAQGALGPRRLPSRLARFAHDVRQLGEDDLPHRQLDGRA